MIDISGNSNSRLSVIECLMGYVGRSWVVDSMIDGGRKAIFVAHHYAGWVIDFRALPLHVAGSELGMEIVSDWHG